MSKLSKVYHAYLSGSREYVFFYPIHILEHSMFSKSRTFEILKSLQGYDVLRRGAYVKIVNCCVTYFLNGPYGRIFYMD